MQPRRRKTISRWKRGRYRLEVALVDTATRVMRRWDRAAARRAGERLGGVLFYVLRRERRIALANLALALGSTSPVRQRRHWAVASFRNVYGTLAGLLWAPRLETDDARRQVENPEAFAAALAGQAERGQILLTLHYGDWELLGMAAAACGVPMLVVARELPNRALGERLARVRGLTGNRIIPQAGAARKLFQELRRGGTVAMLADLNGRISGGGVWVNFFGLPVFNTASVAALALHTGAVVRVLVGEPLPDGRIRVADRGEVRYAPTGDWEADVAGFTQQYMDVAERIIRENPQYWMWSYRRWRFRPSPAQGRYPFYSVYRPMVPRRRGTENVVFSDGGLG